MKLNPRERIMLYILAVLGILAMGYFLMIKPELDMIDSLKLDEIALKTQIQTIDKELATADGLDANLEELLKETEELSKPFYPEILKDRIILILEELINKAEIDSTTTGYGRTVVANVRTVSVGQAAALYDLKILADKYAVMMPGYETPEPVTEDDTVNPELEVPPNQRKVETITIKLQFVGTYAQIKQFISELEALDRTILVTNIVTLVGGSESILEEEVEAEAEEVLPGEELLTTDLEVVFYSIPKIFDQDEEYYEWPDI